MSSALLEVAAAADEVADDQRRIARSARAMQRRRDQGWSWTRILETERGPRTMDLLRRSSRTLARATAAFSRVLARGLGAEGKSHRQIAHHLGVTHQRVSTVLSRRDE